MKRLDPRDLAYCGLFGAAALLLPVLFHLIHLVSCKRKSLQKWPTKIMVASCERAGQKRNWYSPRQSELS